MARGLILSACLISLAPTSAFAQDTALAPTAPSSTAAQEPGGATNRTRLMLGIDLKETITPGADTSNKLGVGFMWRWRSRTASMNDRWAFSYRLGSYSTRVSSPVGGEALEMGPARFRPLLVGAEYKMPRGKWTWGASLNAGWSLNKLDTSSTFRDRLANAMGTGEVTTDIHNSFAWSPRFKGWYDFNRRVSFMVETYYAHNRPEVTIRSGGVDLSRRLNADAVIFKTGLVYGIW